MTAANKVGTEFQPEKTRLLPEKKSRFHPVLIL